jgi:hypothetical protein
LTPLFKLKGDNDDDHDDFDDDDHDGADDDNDDDDVDVVEGEDAFDDQFINHYCLWLVNHNTYTHFQLVNLYMHIHSCIIIIYDVILVVSFVE